MFIVLHSVFVCCNISSWTKYYL